MMTRRTILGLTALAVLLGASGCGSSFPSSSRADMEWFVRDVAAPPGATTGEIRYEDASLIPDPMRPAASARVDAPQDAEEAVAVVEDQLREAGFVGESPSLPCGPAEPCRFVPGYGRAASTGLRQVQLVFVPHADGTTIRVQALPR